MRHGLFVLLILALDALHFRQVDYYHGLTAFRDKRDQDELDDKGKIMRHKETGQEYAKAKSEHEKNEQQQRKQTQEDFFTGKTNVLVANDAFGQGINLPNINLLIHYGVPKGMELYMNQFGRAGRNGEPAKCVLICQPSDFNNHESNIRHDMERNEIDRAAGMSQVPPSFEGCDACVLERLSGLTVPYLSVGLRLGWPLLVPAEDYLPSICVHSCNRSRSCASWPLTPKVAVGTRCAAFGRRCVTARSCSMKTTTTTMTQAGRAASVTVVCATRQNCSRAPLNTSRSLCCS